MQSIQNSMYVICIFTGKRKCFEKFKRFLHILKIWTKIGHIIRLRNDTIYPETPSIYIYIYIYTHTEETVESFRKPVYLNFLVLVINKSLKKKKKKTFFPKSNRYCNPKNLSSRYVNSFKIQFSYTMMKAETILKSVWTNPITSSYEYYTSRSMGPFKHSVQNERRE